MSVKVCKILIGIPGSGKSTYRKKEVVENGATYTNMDEIRISLRKSGNKMPKQQFEKEVKHTKLSKLEDLFKHGEQYVIVDDTHLSTSAINPVVALANKYGYTVEYKFMETSFNILKCHKNNMMRDHSEHVPVQVVETMSENFYKTYFRIMYGELKNNHNLPSAIMVDIDGTIASMNTRGAFEWTRVGEDSIDTKVLELVQYYKSQGHQVIVCSGRDSVCRSETEAWLKKHNVPCDLLLMRKADDMRSDSIVKLELFGGNIYDKFNVHIVLDDRNSVVTVWRGIGLKCLQVAAGWF